MPVKKKTVTKKKTTTRNKSDPRVHTPVKKKASVKKKTTKKAATRKPRKISDKDKIFINNWLGGPDHLIGNATACYRELHPKTKQRSCEVGAEKVMRKVEVQEYLQKRLKKVEEKTEINAAWVLEQSVTLFKKCAGEVEIERDVMVDMPKGEPMKITQTYREFNGTTAKGALELVGKNIAVQAFQDKLDVTGKLDLAEVMARRQKSVEDKAAGSA